MLADVEGVVAAFAWALCCAGPLIAVAAGVPVPASPRHSTPLRPAQPGWATDPVPVSTE